MCRISTFISIEAKLLRWLFGKELKVKFQERIAFVHISLRKRERERE